MFEVWMKPLYRYTKVTVYDVSYDSNGAPLFLVYDSTNNAWVRKAAKHFLPTAEDGAYEPI